MPNDHAHGTAGQQIPTFIRSQRSAAYNAFLFREMEFRFMDCDLKHFMTRRSSRLLFFFRGENRLFLCNFYDGHRTVFGWKIVHCVRLFLFGVSWVNSRSRHVARYLRILMRLEICPYNSLKSLERDGRSDCGIYFHSLIFHFAVITD